MSYPSYRRFLFTALALGACWRQPSFAATKVQSTVADFYGGISSGSAQPMGEWGYAGSATPATSTAKGGVGILPPFVTDVVNDDFNYPTAAAAQSAGWLLQTPNLSEISSLANYQPSEFLLSGDTSVTGGAAPAASTLRLRTGVPFDMFRTSFATSRTPQIALWNTPIKGDFEVETHFTLAELPNNNNEGRQYGPFIGLPAHFDTDGTTVLPGVDPGTGKATTVVMDNNSRWITGSPQWTAANTEGFTMATRMYPAFPPFNATNDMTNGGTPTGNNGFNSQPTNQNNAVTKTNWYIRIVKRGQYFYFFSRQSATDVWAYNGLIKSPDLNDPSVVPDGLIVGVFSKSNGATTGATYRDIDFDYFHAATYTAETGTYSNVLDAGAAVGWQTFALTGSTPDFGPHSMPGVKYQLRAGNTKDSSSNTLTDAGSFVGPDGTSSSYFRDDIGQVVPNGGGKRYLEYKLFLDNSITPDPAIYLPLGANRIYSPPDASYETPTTYPVGTSDPQKNLPAFVRQVSGTYQPIPIPTVYASNTAEFGADSATVQTQPGGGDLSLARSATPLVNETFTTDAIDVNDPGDTFDLGHTWYFNEGNILTGDRETEGGAYTLDERPGYMRIRCFGTQENYFAGSFLGTKMLRTLPTQQDGFTPITDFEAETEVELESQAARISGLILWQDDGNWVSLGVGRNNYSTFQGGVQVEVVRTNQSGNNSQTLPNTFNSISNLSNYGTNHVRLRIAKQGQVVTCSMMDLDSATPSWRVIRVLDTAGMFGQGSNSPQNTVGGDFLPVRIGFLSKASGSPGPDRYGQNIDFHYLKITSLSPSGTKDITFTLPSGGKADIATLLGEAMSSRAASITPTVQSTWVYPVPVYGPINVKFQIKNAGGTFVGPDLTSATYFTSDEPKVPDTLSSQTSITARVFMDAAQPSGVPYLHAIGIQSAPTGTGIVRDTNSVDFAAGLTKTNITTTETAGYLAADAPLGTATIDDGFSAATNWTLFPGGTPDPVTAPTADYNANPGAVRITYGKTQLLDASTRNGVFFYQPTAQTGDWDVETSVSFPSGREGGRMVGIGAIQFGTGATDAAQIASSTDLVFFGPREFHEISLQNIVNKTERLDPSTSTGESPHVYGLTGTTYFLRLRKVGQTFIGYYKANAADAWTELYRANNLSITSPRVGLLLKTFTANTNNAAANTAFPVDFDYFRLTPITNSTGTFESRVLDLSGFSTTPLLAVVGDRLNAAGATLQLRAATTAAGLSSAAYVGPDGTAATSFLGTNAGTGYVSAYNALLPAALTGSRYYQYKAVLPGGVRINDLALYSPVGSTVPFTTADALAALRIAGGLVAATNTQYDVVKADGTSGQDGLVTLQDATKILRSVNGL